MTLGALDRLEKYGVVIAYAFLAARFIQSYRDTGNIVSLFYVLDALIVGLFLLIRRPTQLISNRKSDWFVGVAGTFLPLLVMPPGPTPAVLPLALLAVLMLCGTTMHLAAKLRLFRSFGIIAANRGVVDKGVYGLVRHPMYLGYIIVESVFLLSGPNFFNVAITVSAWILFLFRIDAEERILSADPGYRDFMTRTPFRLLPGVY